MSLKSISRLHNLHRRFESELGEELRQLRPDFARIARLKKFKLRLKDRIHGLERQPQPQGAA